MAPRKRKADEEPEPAASTRMVTRGSEAAARIQTRRSTQGGVAKSVKVKPAAARKKSKKKKEEVKSEQGQEAESEEVNEAEAGEVNTKTTVIERCTQCNAFKTRAEQVRDSLEHLPGITVTINPVKWFTMKRQHAIVMMADSLYYTKFKLHCRPNMDGRNCYSDEHYLPTFFRMKDPADLANWSVTFVDWSERKCHPRAFRTQDVSYDLLRNITSIADSTHVTSDESRTLLSSPCMG